MTDSNSLSRRSLLGGLAVTGAAAVGCGEDAPTGPSADVPTLNALLTAEYQAIKAYEAGLAVLRAPPMGDPQAAFSAPLVVIAGNWQNQHRDHARELAALIVTNRGTAVLESAVMFTAPQGFTPSVANVLKLACNAEKAAAVAYNGAVRALNSTNSRFLAGTIEGDETQHFIVLYTILKGIVAPDPAGLITNIGEVVPRSFVSQVGAGTGSAPGMDQRGLQTVADFTYT